MEGDTRQQRFRWALVLAWAPWIPTLVGLRQLFTGIDNQKAIGVAALVGGMAEMFLLWGLVTLIIAQVVAIIWLLRSFSRDNSARNLLSFVSICASVLSLLLVVGFFWVHHLAQQEFLGR